MSATVALMVLVVDGGATQTARNDAFGLANAAARAGAQGLDDDARIAGRVQLDPVAATALAQSYLAAHGATGEITVEANTVTVMVSRTVDYVFRPGTATVTSTSAVEAATQGDTP
jgi:hypothetical protein